VKKTEQSTLKQKLVNSGANSDYDYKIVGLDDKGTVLNRRNMSVRGKDGNDYASTDIGGDELKFSNNYQNYDCICSFELKDYLIEVWCHKNGTTVSTPVRITFNGVVMVETEKLPYDIDHPLQFDINEACVDPEFYLTDNQSPIWIFNLNSIINCYNSSDITISGTYFGLFNPLLYQAVLNLAPHHPIFREDGLISLPGAGVNPGSYSYSIRYVDEDGNRTSWSVQTPYIPVPASTPSYITPTETTPGAFSFPAISDQHPGVKNYGSAVTNTASNWGIQIEFRVDNIAEYDYIEIRRVRQSTGQAFNYVPTPEKTQLVIDAITNQSVDIKSNIWKFSVVGFLDRASTVWTTLTDEEDTDVTSGWFTCKTLRYFQRRLVAMNITTKSKDVSSKNWFIEKNSKLGFDVMEKMTTNDKLGHYKPWNQVYYPTVQSGEKVGYGVRFIDDYGNTSFVVPFDDLAGHDLKNFQHPNRRVPLSAESLEYSVTKWKGACKCADIYSNAPGTHTNYTHEVIDLVDAITKDDICGFKNMSSNGYATKQLSTVNDGMFSNCTPAPNEPLMTGHTSGKQIGYCPYTPVNDSDSDVSGHNFRVNVAVREKYASSDDPADYPLGIFSPDYNEVFDYNPKGFAPNYFSQGMAFWGLKEYPDWARGFSIVRTPVAGRVICQGIGFYSIGIQQIGATEKNLNQISFWSPDCDTMYSPTTSITDIIDGLKSGAYGIQLVSPLGAFCEVYDGAQPRLISTVRKNMDVDMMVYARVLREDGSINPTFPQSRCGNGSDGYVAYGRWLNIPQLFNQGALWNGSGVTGEQILEKNNSIYRVTNAEPITSGRSNYIKITTDVSIYNYGFIGHSNWIGGSTPEQNLFQIGSTQTPSNPQKYCEPIYIVNIVSTGREVNYGNINNYYETGHVQKIESKIGIWKDNYGGSHSFKLVDERWEDCIPNKLNPDVSNDDDENRYVYVNGLRWLNVTYKPQIFIDGVLNTLQANGYCSIPDKDYNGNSIVGGTTIYGVYKNTGDPGYQNEFSIDFSIFSSLCDAKYQVPPKDATITVRYDNRVPIKLFSGEKVIGETVFAYWDEQQENGFTGFGTERGLISGFPYAAYQINDRVFIALKPDVVPHILDDNEIYPTLVRQLMVNSHLETKTNIPLMFSWMDTVEGGTAYQNRYVYPHTHYVMRPHKWDTTYVNDTTVPLPSNNFLEDNHMWEEYFDDYGFEWQIPNGGWKWGGFKFNGASNIDYSKELNDRQNSSKPLLGFQEVIRFCSRIIWSEPRQINVQDDPNLKSYPSGNKFDISDAYEEIKYAYDNDSSKGNNLYAITGKGICLILTDKTILSDKTSDQIAMLSPETGFIQGEYWLTKDIGCNDQMWRGIAEYNNDIFIPNRRGVFMVDGIEVKDISANYSKELLPYLQYSSSNYLNKMYGVYNKYYNEYWLGFDTVRTVSTVENNRIKTYPAKTFIFCNEPNKLFWAGYSDYFYDHAAFMTKLGGLIVNKVYGSKDFKTYETGVENGLINGSPYDRSVTISVTPQLTQTCELIDITCNSNIKPTDYYYNYKPNAPVICNTDGSVIRDYTNNYYAMCPRRSDNGNRLQNDSFVIDIVYNGADKFEVVSVECGFKPIKW